MTKEARLTQKRLEGEILKLLEGNPAKLFDGVAGCSFCQRYGVIGQGNWVGSTFYQIEDCGRCPIYVGLDGRCNMDGGIIETIDSHMEFENPSAIPGALAIYMWLFEL